MEKRAPQFRERPLTRSLIDTLVAEALAPEAEQRLQVCATLPVVQSGPETRQNPIRLKNLQQEAARRLEAAGAPRALQAQLEHEPFDAATWERLQSFPALWLRYREDETLLVGLPEAWTEQLVVGARPWTRPLIQALSACEVANVLCLTRDGAWALRWSGGRLDPLDLPGLPVTLEAVVGGDRDQPSLQHHSAGGNTQYHGQAINLDDDSDDFERFLRHVEGLLWDAAQEDDTLRELPLWIAATDEVAGAFERASRLAVAGRLRGSPSEENREALAEELSERHSRRRRDQADAALARWRESDRGSEELTELVTAAVAGRIEALVVAGEQPAWGRMALGGQAVQRCAPDEDGATDLVGRTLAHAWATGGTIRSVDHGLARLPESGIAALLRY